jgi:predicted TPR repeat methyltransferase
MIEEAKQKKVYDKLIQTEIIDYLNNNTLNFDYFIAADVFVYIGDLYEVFSLIKKRNKKSGDLVFSIELTTADDYMLEKSGRYSHSINYISSLCDEFGFSITNFKKIPIRKENKQNIPGALYRLRF